MPSDGDTHAEREHQRRHFGMLDAIDAGFCTADEAGTNYLIGREFPGLHQGRVG